MMTVLLVEDNQALAASIADYLLLDDIDCDHAYNGKAGLNLALENQYDVILLDIMLPYMDGLSVCAQLRQQGIDTPILMLTARDTLDDKLAGFTVGTDDYLVKPFAMEELVVRIKALSQRRSGQVKKLQIADLKLDMHSHIATRAEQTLKLTPSGWILLETLMRASPQVVSKAELEKALWQDSPPDTNSLKVHMYNLRQQVDKPFDKALIQTVSGKGFVLLEDKTDV